MKVTKASVPLTLAVYGTLKRDFTNHRLIKEAKLDYRGTLYTKYPDFTMMGGTGFPIVLDGHKGEVGEHILCELFNFNEFSQLNEIDRLEGYPTWYNRRPVQFTDDSWAWMYYQGMEKHSDAPWKRERVVVSKGVARWV
jgi:gamma-glutamylcyclotransferase (GGCT)/AIG2-like uncharacterized protein YtfP